MSSRPFIATEDGVTVFIRATTKASRAGATGIYKNCQNKSFLSLSVTVSAVKGYANKRIIKDLAKICGVASSRVTLCAGAYGRHKRFHVSADPVALSAALNRAVP